MAQPFLEQDMNFVQKAPIQITKFDADLDIISRLDDEPNDVGGLSAAELKATFDKAGNTIKTYLNETLIPAILAADATETNREQAEAGRVAAEQARVLAEKARELSEQARKEAENGRLSAEQAREAAEKLRVTAEEARAAAERDRVNSVTGIVAQATAQANKAETAANKAENAVAQIGGEVDAHKQDPMAHNQLFAEKQGKLVGKQGQIVGFDQAGNAVPVDSAPGSEPLYLNMRNIFGLDDSGVFDTVGGKDFVTTDEMFRTLRAAVKAFKEGRPVYLQGYTIGSTFGLVNTRKAVSIFRDSKTDMLLFAPYAVFGQTWALIQVPFEISTETHIGGLPLYLPNKATADKLGSIIAPDATPEQTEIVGIDKDGKLRVKPSGGTAGNSSMKFITLEVTFPDDKLLLNRSLTAEEQAALNAVAEHETVLLFMNHFGFGDSYPSYWYFMKDQSAYNKFWLVSASDTGEAYRAKLALDLTKNTLKYQVDTAYKGKLQEGSVTLNEPTVRYYAQGESINHPVWARFYGTGAASTRYGWVSLKETKNIAASGATDPSGNCWIAQIGDYDVAITQSTSKPYLKVSKHTGGGSGDGVYELLKEFDTKPSSFEEYTFPASKKILIVTECAKQATGARVNIYVGNTSVSESTMAAQVLLVSNQHDQVAQIFAGSENGMLWLNFAEDDKNGPVGAPLFNRKNMSKVVFANAVDKVTFALTNCPYAIHVKIYGVKSV